MDELRRSVSVRVMAAIGVAVVAAVAVACAPNPNDPGTTTTTTSTTMPWSDPVGVWSHFTMPCNANVFGMPQPFSQSASINVEAPVSVKQGATFEMMVAPGPFIIPVNVSGYDLASLSDVAIRFPVSPNAQFVDSVLSAGKNMGPGYPSVKMAGTDLVYRVPGPFTPGATVQMPLEDAFWGDRYDQHGDGVDHQRARQLHAEPESAVLVDVDQGRLTVPAPAGPGLGPPGRTRRDRPAHANPGRRTRRRPGYLRNFDVVLSASTLPPVWHVGQ